MIATGKASATFDTAKTAILNLGRKGFKQVMIFVPTLATDDYLTVALSYDGSTYWTLSMPDGAASEYAVEIPEEHCKLVDIAGVQFIKLTAPGTNQTVTVNAIAIPY
jgi:hypothetical protein